RGDIVDAGTVGPLADGVDVIVNFAAESHVDRSLEEPGQFIRTDVYGTYVLLEAARRAGHQRFLQVSTDEVYGDVDAGRSCEADPLRPRSPYSATKAAAEMLVWAYRASYGLPAIITRGSNTYGQYQYPEKIVPLFITNALDDLPLPIYGDGAAVRDYLHVEDHCAGIDVALRRGTPGMDYNVGQGGDEVTGVQVADAILKHTGKPESLKQFVRDRPGHDRRYALDASRLRGLGWAPQYDFTVGIAATVAWYRDTQDWWRPLKSGEFWDFYKRNYKVAAPSAFPAPRH
ncbi:MAG: dTDP-glucose 4,6-dehydratase, partial [Candidatus Dormibacteria bacterium]